MSTVQPATEEERQLASQAQFEFDTGKYDACSATLNKLFNSRGQNDAKIMHNKALVDYCKSQYQKTDEYRKALKDACIKVSLNVENVESLDDSDHCIFFYNHAVILYHLRQYNKALVIMEKLFQFRESMEEGSSQKIMFFLIELYIQTHQPKEAMGMISYAEKNLLSKPGQSSDKDNKDANTEEVLRSTISQYKARCFIEWKSIKNCKREIKALMTASNNGMTAPLIYLKANIEYLRGNYRKAIKMLNSAPQQSNEYGENLSVMYNNNLAVIHFHMRKHHLGALYMRRAIQDNTRNTRDLCAKDLTQSLNGIPLKTIGISRLYELLYNMGIQMLHCGQPEAAFDCLLETVQLYQVNPRLWLRLAECCIMAYKANNEEDRKLEKKLQVLQGSIGSGLHRKLILGSGIDTSNKISNDSPALPSTTLEFASLCLKNALMLLPDEDNDNGASTADADNENDNKGSDTILISAPPGSPLHGGEVASLRCSILAALAYVSLCLNDWVLARNYASRLLRQPNLSPAHRYLGHMYLSEAMVALDRIADAVEMLNPENVNDVSVLSPEHQKSDTDKNDRNGEKDQDQESSKGGALYPWSPRELPLARAIMQYNLAVAHAVRGEYDKALNNLNMSSKNIEQPYPAQMFFLKVYLELMEGRRKKAVTIIRENFGHVGPNRVSP